MEGRTEPAVDGGARFFPGREMVDASCQVVRKAFALEHTIDSSYCTTTVKLKPSETESNLKLPTRPWEGPIMLASQLDTRLYYFILLVQLLNYILKSMTQTVLLEKHAAILLPSLFQQTSKMPPLPL